MIVRGGTVVLPGAVPVAADVAVEDGVIAAIGPELEGDGEELDARGLHVLPGAIDVHVHFNEPGRADWEGWETGTSALAAGGATACVEMPLNAHPPTVDGAAFDAKVAAARASAKVDFALWGGLVPGPLERMDELAERGVAGFKAFMCDTGIDDFDAVDDDQLGAGMERAAALGLPVLVHAERPAELRPMDGDDWRAWVASRPPQAELAAIERAIALAEQAGCSLHVVHVSTGAGVAAVAEARARGVDVTCETCPHYLALTEDDLERLGTLAKCAPPLRAAAERDALWEHLARGRIALVASDHSPCPPAMKAGGFAKAWGGIAGAQSTLAAAAPRGRGARPAARGARRARHGRARPPLRAAQGPPGAGRRRRPRARRPARRARRRALRPPPREPVRGPPLRARVVRTLLRGPHRVRGRPRRARRARPPAHPDQETPMSDLTITAGPFAFEARWEREDAPKTCEAFEALLPFRQKIIHVRWSGESAWIPLGDMSTGLAFENHTSHPAPGEILLYPGGYSETEILFPYGGTLFASKMGQLAGNHFLTITKGGEQLRELGRTVLWEGALDIVFDRK